MDVTIDAAVAALQWLDAHLAVNEGKFCPRNFEIDKIVQHLAVLDQYLTGKHDVTHEHRLAPAAGADRVVDLLGSGACAVRRGVLSRDGSATSAIDRYQQRVLAARSVAVVRAA